jgi:hypothetical protein
VDAPEGRVLGFDAKSGDSGRQFIPIATQRAAEFFEDEEPRVRLPGLDSLELPQAHIGLFRELILIPMTVVPQPADAQPERTKNGGVHA